MVTGSHPSSHRVPSSQGTPSSESAPDGEATNAADGASSQVLEEVLRNGEMDVQGRFMASTNATLLVTCSGQGLEVPAVYKPRRGERPLWDFPRGLDRRELATYVLSEALTWGLVPITVQREDAPFGPGSVQHFLEDDGESHYFTLREDPRHDLALKAIAVLDVLANNADRKSGHVIVASGRVWAIDHGLCFHQEPKLRTVIWDYAGQRLPADLVQDIQRVFGDPPHSLLELLDPPEVEALLHRAEWLTGAGRFPEPEDRNGWPPYPWPMV